MVFIETVHRMGTLRAKREIKTFCNPWVITNLVEPQQLYLPDLTRSAEFDGGRRSRTLTFHAPAKKYGALLRTSLAGQDTLPPPHYCLVPTNAIAAQLLGNGKYEGANLKSTRLVSKEVLDRLRTPRAISIFWVILRQQNLQPLSKIQSQVKLWDRTHFVWS